MSKSVCEWRILFTLEMNLAEARYELGGFYCFHWPEQYQGKNGVRNFRATIALLEAAGKDPIECGLPDTEKIQRFLKYTSLRARMDNKATDALLMEVPCECSREFFSRLVQGQDHPTLRRWIDSARVSPGLTYTTHEGEG